MGNPALRPKESGEPDRRHEDPDDDQAPTPFLTEAIGAHQAQDEAQEADQLDGRHVWHASEHTTPRGQPSRPLRGSLAARDARLERVIRDRSWICSYRTLNWRI